MCVCVVGFTLRPPYPRGKSPQNPLNNRLGGHKGRSSSFGKEKHFLLPTGVELRILCCSTLGQLYTDILQWLDSTYSSNSTCTKKTVYITKL